MSLINTVATDDTNKTKRMHAKKVLLWFAIVSMIMVFAGLTSAMIVSRTSGWFSFELPMVMWINTAILIFSSITMNRSLQSAKAGNIVNAKRALWTTLLLGLAFAAGQFGAWSELINNKVYFVGNDTSASYLYVLTALHLAHLAGGLIALSVTLAGAIKGKYNTENILGLELMAIYWHFLDGLWLYLFLFLLFMQ